MALFTKSWIAGSVVKLINGILWLGVRVGSAPVTGCESRVMNV